MFAQAAATAAEMPIGALLQIAGPLGVGGILAWFMWYTVSVTMPKKDGEFTASLNTITEKNSRALLDMQSQYLRERSEWRTDIKEVIERRSMALEALNAATHELTVAVKELTARTEQK